jgi:uncharacterized membrane protein YeiB
LWRLLGVSLLVAAGAELASHQIVSVLAEGDQLSEEETEFLFGTVSMPPLPLFLLSAGGTATTVIALCLVVSDSTWLRRWLEPFVAAGRMALTWYVLHIVLGLGTLELLGLTETLSLPTAVGVGCGVFAMILLISVVRMRTWRIGPLEKLMRKLTDLRPEGSHSQVPTSSPP